MFRTTSLTFKMEVINSSGCDSLQKLFCWDSCSFSLYETRNPELNCWEIVVVNIKISYCSELIFVVVPLTFNRQWPIHKLNFADVQFSDLWISWSIAIKQFTNSRTEQNRTEQNRTEQNRTEQNREWTVVPLNFFHAFRITLVITIISFPANLNAERQYLIAASRLKIGRQVVLLSGPYVHLLYYDNSYCNWESGQTYSNYLCFCPCLSKFVYVHSVDYP